jgi:hypothetical protein
LPDGGGSFGTRQLIDRIAVHLLRGPPTKEDALRNNPEEMRPGSNSDGTEPADIDSWGVGEDLNLGEDYVDERGPVPYVPESVGDSSDGEPLGAARDDQDIEVYLMKLFGTDASCAYSDDFDE